MSAFDDMFTNAMFLPIFKETVSYASYPYSTSTTVTAMSSKISNRQQLEYGMSLMVEGLEWLIKIEDLGAEPQKGDRITKSDGTIYEVSRFESQPEWEYDVDRNYYRIRTQLVEENPSS